jgi:Domain of unknown function (DUF1707)
MGDPSSLRIADADRDQTVSELREHAVAGRLTPDELEERIGSAYRATTRADLDKLKADLPVSSTSVEVALSKRKARLRRRLLQEAGGAAGVSAICVGIWVAAGASGSFWPGWVIAFTLVPVVANAWRLLGPASDLELVHARVQARHERRLARGRGPRYPRLPR